MKSLRLLKLQIADPMPGYFSGNIMDSIRVHIENYSRMPIECLEGILYNQEVFKYIINNESIPEKEFTFYHNYLEVSAKFAIGKVLIYMPDLCIYQLFATITDYKSYLTRMAKNAFTSEVFARQLVLISAAHNFIIKCENRPELIDSIKETMGLQPITVQPCGIYAQLKFKETLVTSFVQEQQLFEQIIKRVSDESIHVPRHGSDNRFVEFDISPLHAKNKENPLHINEEILQKLEKLEEYIMQNKTNYTFNYCNGIAIQSKIGEINNNVKKKSKSETEKAAVHDWIRNNPIDGQILKDEYRAKFLADTCIVIHPNTWGKYANELIEGFTNNGKSLYRSK
jgi:hypothetical protein